jgi:hypothetical protein
LLIISALYAFVDVVDQELKKEDLEDLEQSNTS